MKTAEKHPISSYFNKTGAYMYWCFIVNNLIFAILLAYSVVIPLSGFWATFLAVRYCSPGPQHAVPVYYVKMITHLPAKGFVGARGGTYLKNLFFLFSICLIQQVSISAPK